MIRCTKCVLPETFPGITFNDQGVCHYCQQFKGLDKIEKEKEIYQCKFDELLAEYRGHGDYDCLMAYSGGKDSTYTLTILKEKYSLNILAITFDNSFLSEWTFENVRNVVEKLGVDHIYLKPRFDVLKKIFCECAKSNIYPSKALKRASVICTSCIGIVKFSILRMALDKGVPLIAFGWSPGQAPIKSSIMKNNSQMVKIMQKVTFEPLYGIVGAAIKPYFLEDKYFENKAYQFPYSISPLCFLEYNEKKIYNKIKQLGWKAPQDTDANSTNCLLNSFANAIHKEQFGFHPYVFETAGMVRDGILSRKQGLEKVTKEEDQNTIGKVKRKLRID